LSAGSSQIRLKLAQEKPPEPHAPSTNLTGAAKLQRAKMADAELAAAVRRLLVVVVVVVTLPLSRALPFLAQRLCLAMWR
jgi:hypothetical protein